MRLRMNDVRSMADREFVRHFRPGRHEGLMRLFCNADVLIVNCGDGDIASTAQPADQKSAGSALA